MTLTISDLAAISGVGMTLTSLTCLIGKTFVEAKIRQAMTDLKLEIANDRIEVLASTAAAAAAAAATAAVKAVTIANGKA